MKKDKVDHHAIDSAKQSSQPVLQDDPWKHRSASMKCASCMWYIGKNNVLGRCRRHAPTMSGYPVVFIMDWCGDHKLDENKI